ncbi:hypothetical protein [Sporolactobacillus nakayamae]|nr:hypothetical protein [Sporolactobacillus nakayamae]
MLEATNEFAERIAGNKTYEGAIQLTRDKPIDDERIIGIAQWSV